MTKKGLLLVLLLISLTMVFAGCVGGPKPATPTTSATSNVPFDVEILQNDGAMVNGKVTLELIPGQTVQVVEIRKCNAWTLKNRGPDFVWCWKLQDKNGASGFLPEKDVRARHRVLD